MCQAIRYKGLQQELWLVGMLDPGWQDEKSACVPRYDLRGFFQRPYLRSGADIREQMYCCD
jgi:hypothetical protein